MGLLQSAGWWSYIPMILTVYDLRENQTYSNYGMVRLV